MVVSEDDVERVRIVYSVQRHVLLKFAWTDVIIIQCGFMVYSVKDRIFHGCNYNRTSSKHSISFLLAGLGHVLSFPGEKACTHAWECDKDGYTLVVMHAINFCFC